MNETTPMLAAQYDSYGPPEVLKVRTVPLPVLKPGHVLVKVAATSINGADIAVRAGKLKLISGRTFPRGAGYDFAGTVTQAAGDVRELAPGDEVWGFVDSTRAPAPSAAAAEYVVAPVTGTALRPRALTAAEAVALGAVGASALGVLRDVLGLRPGKRVLVRGANGGVGTAAVQVARALGGKVTALASAPHLDRLRDLGAEQAFDYHLTSPGDLGKFDVIIDPVSRGIRPYQRLLAPGGRMAAMAIGSPADLAYLLASRVHGSRRVRFAQSPPVAALLTDLVGYADAKIVTPVIDSVYPLADIAAAHRSLEQSGGFGKRVVEIL
jgi:NADPH:quinone reductase-like Zn-dependent oxidoreductase